MTRTTTPAKRYSYEIVANQLQGDILRGKWRAGEQLPNLEELVALFGFSRMTVFKALQKLESDGLITMSRGRGTFVRKHPARPTLGFVTRHLLDAPYNGFSNQVAMSLEKRLHARGWNLRLYADAPEGSGLGSWELVEALEKQALRGLITVNSNLPDRYLKSPEWTQVAVPHVDMSTHQTAHGIDFMPGRREALITATCQERGIRRLGLIAGQMHDLPGKLRQADLQCPPEWCIGLGRDLTYEEGGFRAMQRLWQQTDRPEALYVDDDVIAKGVLQALLALGARVPDELLVIASVNEPSGMFYPLPMVKIIIDTGAIADQMLRLFDELEQTPSLPPITRYVEPYLDTRMLG